MQDSASVPLLEIIGLNAGYGDTNVLRGVSLSVATGEMLAVIGHNAAGKSTLLKAIIGGVPRISGVIRLDGSDVSPRPWEMRRRGVVYCAQGQRVFGALTVNENLRFACATAGAPFTTGRVRETATLFPELDRYSGTKAVHLSGGERQMVSLAMAFIAPARLMIFDEPTVGLSNDMAARFWRYVTVEPYRAAHAVIVVEHELQTVIDHATQLLVLRQGEPVFSAPARGTDTRAIHKLMF
jgi:urea transport system ATP-binding protein